VPVHSSAPDPTPAPKAKRSRKFGVPKPKLRMSSTAVIVASCSLVIVTLAGLSGFLYLQNKNLKSNPSTNTQATADRLIQKVGKLYALPKEDPTVAAIKDINQLKGQAFFKGAQNGDSILVFPKAKIALLYREKENRIINIGPVSFDGGDQASTGSQNTTGNGTQTLGAETKNP